MMTSRTLLTYRPAGGRHRRRRGRPATAAQPGGNVTAATADEIVLSPLTGDPGTPPRLAVPDFLALSSDRETQEVARTIAEVLWNDLDFEREFYMIPRDTYESIPVAPSIGDPPFDRWRELGADGVVMGSVQKTGTTRPRRDAAVSACARGSRSTRASTAASAANPRLYAHTIADEIHQSQRQLRGVARTKLTFSSDRNRERVAGTVENRDVKEVYIADYDGANQRRITVGRQLNITPVWSPDGRAIAYTSYRTRLPGHLRLDHLRRDDGDADQGDASAQNWLPVFSPDGTRIAFTSNRDGNPEIYVMNRDGSNLRRLTNHPPIDVDADLVADRHADRVHVGSRRLAGDLRGRRRRARPAPDQRSTATPIGRPGRRRRTTRSRTPRAPGPGYDIKVLNIADGDTRQITFGEGSNESPAWAPNGRHLAFTSTRAGRTQIFTVDRDGKNVRQITREGNNCLPQLVAVDAGVVRNEAVESRSLSER